MIRLSTPEQAQAYARKTWGRIVLVPTMGALHAGHAVLLAAARQLAGKRGKVVATLFVNPTQFGPGEDLQKYPRTLAADQKLCRREGVDVLFVPAAEAMYAANHSIFIQENDLSRRLCGASRPGHFAGVCTIVAKLFLLFQPKQAIFGEKDWQQLAILRRLVRDLNFPVEIIGYPTVREPDGLALSSRNRYLTPAERAAAPQIFQALQEAQRSFDSGQPVAKIQSALRRKLRNIPGARLDYAEVVDATTLQPCSDPDCPLQAMVAVHLGTARLIDNLPLNPTRQTHSPHARI